MIEITKAHTIAFIKSRNSLLVRCSERQKKEYGVNLFVNSIQDVWMGGWGGGGGLWGGGPPTSFPPATSTNVGISPKNFLTFTYNLFVTLA